jgi:hypothetical protein
VIELNFSWGRSPDRQNRNTSASPEFGHHQEARAAIEFRSAAAAKSAKPKTARLYSGKEERIADSRQWQHRDIPPRAASPIHQERISVISILAVAPNHDRGGNPSCRFDFAVPLSRQNINVRRVEWMPRPDCHRQLILSIRILLSWLRLDLWGSRRRVFFGFSLLRAKRWDDQYESECEHQIFHSVLRLADPSLFYSSSKVEYCRVSFWGSSRAWFQGNAGR